jgi:hypothetical protein
MKRFKFSLRGAKLALFAYVLFDLLIGGICGGLLPLSPLAAAQTAPSLVPFGQQFGYQHRVGALFLAPGYGTWNATVLSGNAATGSQSIVISGNSGGIGGLSLADGTTIPLAVAFNTLTPITIMDANQETVTPSAVSTPAPCGPGFAGVGSTTQCVTVTATFANTHGASAVVVSGDAGIGEAITDAGNQGGGLVYWTVDTGVVTLNTGALTTTTTTKVPTTFYGEGAAARVTTTITTSTNWAVGISGSTSAFCSANATLTAGTTCIANQVAPAAIGTTNTLTALLVTVTGANAGAGAVKIRVWGWTPVQPAS